MYIFYSIVDFENQKPYTPGSKKGSKKLQNSCVIKRIELILRYNNKARALDGFTRSPRKYCHTKVDWETHQLYMKCRDNLYV